jgi:nuclear GTP-binding protein
LLQLLKNYSRNLNLHTSISVDVIGYPNVGKSSIINSLKRCRAVSTGATPGLTKKVQEVHLDSKIKLLDSPGVLFRYCSGSASLLFLPFLIACDVQQ